MRDITAVFVSKSKYIDTQSVSLAADVKLS